MRELLKPDIILINCVFVVCFVSTLSNTHLPFWKDVLKLNGLCFLGLYDCLLNYILI